MGLTMLRRTGASHESHTDPKDSRYNSRARKVPTTLVETNLNCS